MAEDGGSSLFKKIFKNKNEEEEQNKAEEEILTLVEEGQEKGLIEDDTKDIIENVFDFDDTVAYEIMTHRRDMISVDYKEDIEKIIDTAIASGHSRIPVFKEDIDNIIGILYVKDMLKFVGKAIPDDFSVESILRKAIFVPRTKDLHSLYELMIKEKIQIVIVVDEYGGTEGIITLEDLIEDILGSIQDEYDDEEEEIRKINDSKFTVDGSTSLEDISELTGESIYAEDCETIAGFIFDKLGRVPQDNERPEIEEGKLKIKVLETDERRISKVLIEKTDKD